MSAAPYRVTVHHYGGGHETTECATFEAALVVARKLQADNPKLLVDVWNDDRFDLDFDGLTLEEREQVEEALELA